MAGRRDGGRWVVAGRGGGGGLVFDRLQTGRERSKTGHTRENARCERRMESARGRVHLTSGRARVHTQQSRIFFFFFFFCARCVGVKMVFLSGFAERFQQYN